MARGRTTQEALGALLKDQLQHRPLSKITVAGLAHAAGVSRQAFYYHFEDVYALAVWVFERDVADHIMRHASHAQWAEGFRRMLLYMRQNREQTYAVINSLSHREFERFFFHQFRAMTTAIVEELQGDVDLTETDRSFVIDHFTMIVLGHLLHWLVGGMIQDPDVLVPKLEKVLRGNLRASLEVFASGGSHPAS